MPPKWKAKNKLMEVSDEDDCDDYDEHGQIIVKPGPSQKRPLVDSDSDSDAYSSESDLNTNESVVQRVKRTRTRSNSVKSTVKTHEAKPKINTKQGVKRCVKNQKEKIKT